MLYVLHITVLCMQHVRCLLALFRSINDNNNNIISQLPSFATLSTKRVAKISKVTKQHLEN